MELKPRLLECESRSLSSEWAVSLSFAFYHYLVHLTKLSHTYRADWIREPQVYETTVRVHYDGTATIKGLMKTDIGCGLDLKEFPFDAHTCIMYFGILTFSTEEIRFNRTQVTVSKADTARGNSEFMLTDLEVCLQLISKWVLVQFYGWQIQSNLSI